MRHLNEGRWIPLTVLAAIIGLAGAQSRNWVLSREITPAQVLAHFPLQVGNRWLYETKYFTGDTEKPHLDHWIWEVRITKHVQTADGLIVYRQRRELQVLQGEPYDQSGLRADPYLVRSGYVYELSSMFWESKEATNNDPINQAQVDFMGTGRREFVKRLLAGEITPSFFFPMRAGLMWAERQREDADYREWMKSGTRPDDFYHWVVVANAKGGRGACGCMTLSPKAFDVLYSTNGGPTEFFFQDGVGVIGHWNRHGGTYWEEITTLKRFIPASLGSKSDPAGHFHDPEDDQQIPDQAN